MLLDFLTYVYMAFMVACFLMQFRAMLAKNYELLKAAIDYVLPAGLAFIALKGFLAIFIADWFSVGTAAACVFLGILSHSMLTYRQLPRLEPYRKMTEEEKFAAEQQKIVDELNKI
jgi:hypothetical protein